VIKRYISEGYFDRVKKDFAFLVKRIHKERGEYDLRLRHNSMNLYYKGNSMAKIGVTRGDYDVKIHEKFTDLADTRDPRKLTGYKTEHLSSSQLRSFFSKRELDKRAARIKKTNWGEEVSFEQMLITDNPPTKKFMIIDRQVTGGALDRHRLDLLALKRKRGAKNIYSPVILEVKLGNNPELAGAVLEQLCDYIERMERDLTNIARCYETSYSQMNALGLLEDGMPKAIEIAGPVEGMIVVGGYSGIANNAIKSLRKAPRSLEGKSEKRISIWQADNSLLKGSVGLIA